MVRTLIAAVLLAALFLTAGCAAVVVGAGAGTGVYTWVKGELIRSYAQDVDHTRSATVQSLEYLKIHLFRERIIIPKVWRHIPIDDVDIE